MSFEYNCEFIALLVQNWWQKFSKLVSFHIFFSIFNENNVF